MVQRNRTIPFGYTMINGKREINEIEAAVIHTIFEQYINGMSLQIIAEQIEVPYNENKCKWNKNMVSRILENRKYLGENGFMEIIDKESFNKAGQIRKERSTYKRPVIEDIVRLKIISKKQISGYHIVNVIHSIIESITANPMLLNVECSGNGYISNEEIMRMNNEINRLIDTPDSNPDEIKKMIFECAGLKYKQIGVNETAQNTAEIKQIICESNGKISPEVLNTIAEIYCEECISIKFINGAIIEERRTNDAISNSA